MHPWKCRSMLGRDNGNSKADLSRGRRWDRGAGPGALEAMQRWERPGQQPKQRVLGVG
jgi:hypothetical protein